MANPNPAHNPTDGLLTAVYVQLSGTGITQVHGTASGSHPNPGPYQVTLSLSGTSTVTVTPSLVDVASTTYSATTANWVFQSYNYPNITENTFSSLSPSISYTAKIANVGASGAATCLVTGVAKGQAIVEFSYPTFDNTEGTLTGTVSGGSTNSSNLTVPKDRIYAQLIVTVTT